MNRFIYLLIIIVLHIVKIKAQNENAISNYEKIYGLSAIWKECSYNFAFFNRISSLDWDSCYKSYIPQVLNTENDWQYYLVLQRFISNLCDGHTRVYPPVSLRECHSASINHLIRTRLIHNRIFIEDVFSDSLIKHGLVKGLEISKVDDIDVLEYAQKFVVPYICASTKQDFDYQTYTVYLLNGELSKPVKITTKSEVGSLHEFVLKRKKWLREITPYENIPLKYQLINDKTGYLKINHFGGGDGFQRLFDSIYTEVKKTNKLIIDIRQNFGGASDNAWYVLQHLIDTTFKVPGWKSPMFIAAHKSWKFKEEWFYNKVFELTPIPDISIYNKPIFLLIDESTFSAAEDFCIIFKVANRGLLIGRKTAGSTGNSVLINLPANGFARVCAKHDYFEGIAEYEGLGIEPDLEVNYEINNLQFDHDIILNTVIKLIN